MGEEESKREGVQVAEKVTESIEKVAPPKAIEMASEGIGQENGDLGKEGLGSNGGQVLVVEEKKIEGGAEAEEAAEEKKSEAEEKKSEAEAGESSSSSVEKSPSFREESNLPSDLKENEKKALVELKSKLEDAIVGNGLFGTKVPESSAEEGEKLKENDGEEEEKAEKEEADKKGKSVEEGEGDKEICLWGIPLLPSKGDKGLDAILLKFLRARELKVDEAFEMLRRTLQWSRESSIDSISSGDFDVDLRSIAYMKERVDELVGVLEGEGDGKRARESKGRREKRVRGGERKERNKINFNFQSNFDTCPEVTEC